MKTTDILTKIPTLPDELMKIIYTYIHAPFSSKRFKNELHHHIQYKEPWKLEQDEYGVTLYKEDDFTYALTEIFLEDTEDILGNPLHSQLFALIHF